jgi:hypothetical protein
MGRQPGATAEVVPAINELTVPSADVRETLAMLEGDDISAGSSSEAVGCRRT